MKIILTSCLLLITAMSFSQKDTSLPVYLQFKVIPQFKLMKTDSSWLTRDDLSEHKSTIIMLFSPDCEHCQHQTEILLENVSKLKHVQIVMATTSPLDKIDEFTKKYKLNEYGMFMLGRDPSMFFGTFYQFKATPFLAIYNKKRELVTVFDGGAKWKKLEVVLKQ